MILHMMPFPLDAADWTLPIPIHYGLGRLAELGRICAQAGMRNPLVVTDRGSRDLPFIAHTTESLRAAGLDSAVFSEVAPNPTDRDIQTGRAAYRAGGHGGVIAIGGGSGMDAGKAISLVAGNDRDLWSFDYDREPVPVEAEGAFAPLVCVPTTAGTGAETESTAMVTDSARTIKRCVWHPRHRPLAAILDPELTVGLPPNLTAWTGCDALVHAIEAYCVPQWHPICDGVALEAMGLIHRWVGVAVDEPDNLEARGAMLAGSCLAGVAFLKGLGLVHALSHMIGAAYDTHHGLTNAVLLPVVLRYNGHAIADRVPAMCQAMGLPGRGFDDFYGGTVALLDRLDIPRRLADLGVEPERAWEIAKKALTDPAAATNPAPASLAQIEGLLLEGIRQAR